MTAPAYTRHFWAKSDRANPQRIHLLEHHMADVGACLEALLAQPTIRQRLARSGGRDDLDPATVARLCVFAALHDVGKANVEFQARIWGPEGLPSVRSTNLQCRRTGRRARTCRNRWKQRQAKAGSNSMWRIENSATTRKEYAGLRQAAAIWL